MKVSRRLPIVLLQLLLLPVSLLLGSCSKGQEPMPAPVYLFDQAWQLTELQGQPIREAKTENEATTLLLSSVTSAATGRAGCTAYRNAFLLVAGTDNLLFAPPVDSGPACLLHEPEAHYLALLPQVRRYTISRRRLQFYDSAHEQPVLVFEAK